MSSVVNRIVLNVPHASPVFPFGKECWESGIEAEIVRWTDWYTDWLFQSGCPMVHSVVYPFSRFFCDVERLENDPLEGIGQGIVYERFNGFRRMLSEADISWIMASYYEHLNRLKSLIRDEHTLLIDCHSFPEDLSNIDICIGFNDDWSKPSESLICLVEAVFHEAGLTVGLNSPYSNSISPDTGFTYQSVMIEVNKGVYMGHGGDPDGLTTLKKIIQTLYARVLVL